MGWLELNEIGDEEELVLESPIGLAENSAVIMRNGNKETFIFENRQPGTWYPTTFGKGVLVSRIAYDKTAWSYNTVNNVQSKKRACVLTANNETLYYSGSSANLYGGSGKTSINKLKTLSGSTIDPGITDIQKNSDGTITLTFEGNGNIDDPDDPKPSEDGVFFYESFDQCANKGGNDGMWNGAIASGTFFPDNDGWVTRRLTGLSNVHASEQAVWPALPKHPLLRSTERPRSPSRRGHGIMPRTIPFSI
jgi:hypothetical protein